MKKINKFFFGFHLSIIMLIAGLLHQIHISRTEIVFDENTNSLQLSMQLDVKDLELALRENEDKSFYIGEKNEVEGTDSLIFEYINDHFSIEQIDFDYVGKELDDDLQTVWIYLEREIESLPNPFIIQNTLLIEIDDEQKNIVKVKLKRNKKSRLLFTKNVTKKSLNLDND